jgi:hypothetical protein
MSLPLHDALSIAFAVPPIANVAAALRVVEQGYPNAANLWQSLGCLRACVGAMAEVIHEKR